MGPTARPPDVVARSMPLLFAEDKPHGDVIYSWDGHYREVNNAGGLSMAAELLGNAHNEECHAEAERAKGRVGY